MEEAKGLLTERWFKKLFHRHSLLGDTVYFDPHSLPVAKDLEDNYPAIKVEIDRILERYDEIALFQDISPDQDYISSDDKWRLFFFRAFNVNFKRNQQLAPETMKVLNRHKGVVAAYVSILGPNKMLMPHKGPYSGILRMHLGVRVPERNKCVLVAGGEKYFWEEGKTVLFDDSFDHFAVNPTNELRAILFLDIMRPLPWSLHFINWLHFKVSLLTPYVIKGYFALKAWEKDFYGRSNGRISSS